MGSEASVAEITHCLLVRHAAHGLLSSTLVGRMDGVPLSADGREQAAALGRRLAPLPIGCLQSSPRQRARETADIIASSCRTPVEVCPALDELDYGAWTGKSFVELSHLPQWRSWNSERGCARPCGGESMREVQARITLHLRALTERRLNGVAVLVTHAEIIRAVLLNALGLPLERWLDVDVAPASITRVCVAGGAHASVRLPAGIGCP